MVTKIIRTEPGLYRITAAYDGTAFDVVAETASPVTLTLRVEDVWNRMPARDRRHDYRVDVLPEDGQEKRMLEHVAPDARIQFDLNTRTVFRFTPC